MSEAPGGTGPPALLPEPVARALRARALRRQRKSQLRDLREFRSDLRRAEVDRPHLLQQKLDAVLATDDELLALGSARAPSPKAEVSEPAPSRRRTISPAAWAAFALLGAVAVAVAVVVLWPHDRAPAPPRAAAPPVVAPAKIPPRPPAATPRRHHVTRRPAPRPSARALGERTLSSGISGKDVRLLQRLLAVKPTGVFNAGTAAAVRKFQRAHGLPQTGVVATQTHAALKRKFP